MAEIAPRLTPALAAHIIADPGAPSGGPVALSITPDFLLLLSLAGILEATGERSLSSRGLIEWAALGAASHAIGVAPLTTFETVRAGGQA